MTKIQWTDETLNVSVGCERVSDGCLNCYAMGVAHRGMQPAHRGLTVMTEHGVDWTGEVRLVPDRLEVPFRWRRSRHIFWNSMSDLWHPDVPRDFLAQCFAVMALTPQHRHQILTKRPKRMALLLADAGFESEVFDAITRHLVGDELPFPIEWPLPNAWVAASIEDDSTVWRADDVRRTPARVRWLSLEPLLGPLPSLDLTGIDQIVIGGESGRGARRMDLGWVEDAMAAAEAAGTRVFVKQLGSVLARELGLSDSKGGDISEWPEWLRVREMPEVAS